MDNWIVSDTEHLGGSPRVRGTRISVVLVLESFAAGMTIAEIVDAYPSLTEESVPRRLPRGLTIREFASSSKLKLLTRSRRPGPWSEASLNSSPETRKR